jgi:microcystin-dependent protein
MPGTPATSPRLGIPRYANTDAADFATDVNAITDRIDSVLSVMGTGTYAARPVAGTANRFYFATDRSVLYWDNGSVWARVDPEDNAITNAKMADNSVNTAELVDSSVTSAKIANLAVATGDLADLAVTTAKIANNAVGATQLAASGLGLVPVGAIMMWPTAVAPTDWLLCDGATNVPSATWPALVAILGVSGANLLMPDFRGRFPAGPGTPVGGGLSVGNEDASNGALLAPAGKGKYKLLSTESGLPVHLHADGTLATASHSHTYAGASGRVPTNTVGFVRVNVTHGSGAFNNNFVAYSGAGTDTSDSGTDTFAPDVTGSTANNTAADAAGYHENRPPFLPINFIIRGR